MSARRCNECTLCCTLLPVAEIGKGASQKCLHQRAKGCRIHQAEGYPLGCQLWSCAWLADESFPLPRPDRAGYVVDLTPEFVEINGKAISVVQVWVDPRSPDAHRDPGLRAWLADLWDEHRQLALVRFDSVRGMVPLPPAITGGDWHEQGGRADVQHSAAQIAETLGLGQRR